MAAAKNKVAALEYELQKVKQQSAKDPLGLVKEANKEKTRLLQGQLEAAKQEAFKLEAAKGSTTTTTPETTTTGGGGGKTTPETTTTGGGGGKTTTPETTTRWRWR